MGRLRTCVACALLMTCAAPGGGRTGSSAQAPAGIVVRLEGSVAQQALDGRLLLLVSKNDAREPRFQVSATSLSSAQVFGVDVEGLKAGDERTFDATVLGYPLESLRDLPPGEYTVQALLHKYETFRLATGHTVKLPMDRGEGQRWRTRADLKRVKRDLPVGVGRPSNAPTATVDQPAASASTSLPVASAMTPGSRTAATTPAAPASPSFCVASQWPSLGRSRSAWSSCHNRGRGSRARENQENQMKRLILTATLAATAMAAMAAPAAAQPPDTSFKGQYELVKGWITKSAATMPEADYGFKPTPDVRSFGQVLGHIANAVGMICVAPTGAKSPLAGNAEQLATKAELTKALADVFAACDKAWAGVTPSWNTEMVDFFGKSQPKMGVIAFNTSHLFEHYGNLVTYLRLKGHVPPSSAKG